MWGRLFALALVSLTLAACATGGLVASFDDDASVPADASVPRDGSTRDDAASDASSSSDAPVTSDAARDASDASNATDASDASTSGTVLCGGYAYPENVTANVTCTGTISACTGAHEFRVVGCYTAPPAGNPCPAGFKVAALMLIGQWAAAAGVTRESQGSVCMYAGGLATTTSACGFDAVNFPYCWKRGDLCCPSCPSNCCQSHCVTSAPCTAPQGYQAPVLCVR
jgi:hypothetical protein